MQKIILLRGLPASGKSTFAKQYIEKQTNTKRINKDDLRAMLDNGKYSKGNEKFVLTIRDNIVRQALSEGKNVIIDDTNLHDKHLITMQEIAKEFKNVIVEVNDSFLSVPIEECIKRDLLRPNSVGENVIKRMAKLIEPNKNKVEQNKDLPKAVIFDIDGTLAIMGDRSPYDWAKVGIDTVNESVRQALHNYHKLGYVILICSGRDSVCREETSEWLLNNNITFNELQMRPINSQAKDTDVKKDMLNKLVKDYYIEAVFDDRDSVVQMWRDNGLTCFQVNYGDF